MTLFFLIAFIAVICLIPIVLPIFIVVKIVKHINRKKAENSEITEISAKEPKVKKERVKLSSSTVMLLIGTAFVSLSGIAFGVAGWVNTAPTGRILIMLLASAVSFGISVLFRKLFKLENTSTAFYSIGSLLTSVMVVTAGWFEMFGHWFSVFGNGKYLLFAFSLICLALLSLLAYRIYKKSAFEYIGISSVSVIILFLSLQFTYTFRQLAVTVAVLQMIITACMNFIKNIRKSVEIVGTVTSLYFGAISFSYCLSKIDEPDFCSYSIILILLAQLLFYGIYFNKKWCIVLQNMVSIYLAIEMSFSAESEYGDDMAVVLFGITALTIYTANKFIPQLKNLFTELLSLSTVVFSAITIIGEVREYKSNYSLLIVPVFASLIVLSYVFHEKKAFQVIAGFASPIIPCTIGNKVSELVYDNLKASTDTVVYGCLGLIFTAVTLLIIYLPKYAFEFHANHPRKTNTILHINAILVSAVILECSDCSEGIILTILVCLLHFFTANKLRNNLTSTASLIGLSIMLDNQMYQMCRIDKISYSTASWIMGIVAGVLMIASKFVYPNAVIKKDEKGIKFDTVLLGSISFAVFTEKEFICLILSALFTACLVKKNTKQSTASVLLSVSAVLTAIAMFNRDFALSNSEIISHKINIGILALMGVAYKYIWKHNEKFSKVSSTTIFILSFASLLYDCLWYATMGNTIFTLCVTGGILALSFMTKSKTWFTVSSVAVFAITVHATHKYLTSLNWWVYLFVAGIVFIGLAGVNEYFKTKGETAKSALARVFSDWNW